MFDDDGLFTPCHSNMEGTEGVKWGSGVKCQKWFKGHKTLNFGKI